MTTVTGDEQRDVGVGRERRIPERIDRDERIILGGDDKGRDTDPMDDPQGTGAVVVVARIGESKRRCRVGLVELTNGPDAAEAIDGEASRVRQVLAAHAGS